MPPAIHSAPRHRRRCRGPPTRSRCWRPAARAACSAIGSAGLGLSDRPAVTASAPWHRRMPTPVRASARATGSAALPCACRAGKRAADRSRSADGPGPSDRLPREVPWIARCRRSAGSCGRRSALPGEAGRRATALLAASSRPCAPGQGRRGARAGTTCACESVARTQECRMETWGCSGGAKRKWRASIGAAGCPRLTTRRSSFVANYKPDG